VPPEQEDMLPVKESEQADTLRVKVLELQEKLQELELD
jgi:hypothetical protein